MLSITTKGITLNNIGNLNIKSESNLCDNAGNRIGVVKIELPNCKVEDGEIVAMGSSGVKTGMNREQRRKIRWNTNGIKIQLSIEKN